MPNSRILGMFELMFAYVLVLFWSRFGFVLAFFGWGYDCVMVAFWFGCGRVLVAFWLRRTRFCRECFLCALGSVTNGYVASFSF